MRLCVCMGESARVFCVCLDRNAKGKRLFASMKQRFGQRFSYKLTYNCKEKARRRRERWWKKRAIEIAQGERQSRDTEKSKRFEFSPAKEGHKGISRNENINFLLLLIFSLLFLLYFSQTWNKKKREPNNNYDKYTSNTKTSERKRMNAEQKQLLFFLSLVAHTHSDSLHFSYFFYSFKLNLL